MYFLVAFHILCGGVKFPMNMSMLMWKIWFILLSEENVQFKENETYKNKTVSFMLNIVAIITQ